MTDLSAATRTPHRRAAALPPFQTLVDEHADAVFRFLVKHVGHEEADDCFQDTFLAALTAYPRLRDAQNLRGWLLAIARHKATDSHRRSARARVPVGERVTSGPAVATGDPEMWEAVRRLPPKQRSALALRFAEDRSYADIARAMDTSQDAARRNVHEGIKKLRREHA